MERVRCTYRFRECNSDKEEEVQKSEDSDGVLYEWSPMGNGTALFPHLSYLGTLVVPSTSLERGQDPLHCHSLSSFLRHLPPFFLPDNDETPRPLPATAKMNHAGHGSVSEMVTIVENWIAML